MKARNVCIYVLFICFIMYLYSNYFSSVFQIHKYVTRDQQIVDGTVRGSKSTMHHSIKQAQENMLKAMKITQTQIIQETLNKNPSSSTTLSKRKKKKENNHPIFDVSKESIDVKSSVKGNLSPANIVLNGKSNNWLKDRWQAAKNMQGVPIPGKHFIQFIFKNNIDMIKQITLDYETAYSSKYVLTVYNDQHPTNNIVTLYSYKVKPIENNICQPSPADKSKNKHVIYILNCNTNNDMFKDENGNVIENINTFKIEMEHSTNWGVSLWNVDIIGRYS